MAGIDGWAFYPREEAGPTPTLALAAELGVLIAGTNQRGRYYEVAPRESWPEDDMQEERESLRAMLEQAMRGEGA